ncbi:MAG TPA: amino acid racemase [Ramlibacter sp.]|nr:amino acid racemase [Ramlibacter sp.]
MNRFARRIGLVGGMAWPSTELYYRRLNREVERRLGPGRSADLVCCSLDFGPLAQAAEAGRWDEITGTLADAVRRLAAAGADFALLAAMTPHRLLPQLQPRLALPVLHVAAPLARALAQVRRVALLGTSHTAGATFVDEHLPQGASLVRPAPEVQARLDAIIFGELAQGRAEPASAAWLDSQLQALHAGGCDAALLACTELPLLLPQLASPALPCLDAVALHAAQAVAIALGDPPPWTTT